MGVKIEISGDNFGNDAELFNGTTIKDGVDIKISDSNFKDRIKMFNDTEIGNVIDEVEKKMETLPRNSAEYNDLSKITKMGHDSKEIRGQIIKHIGMFANGVLQNVVSHLITGI